MQAERIPYRNTHTGQMMDAVLDTRADRSTLAQSDEC
jgi:hypothetical protein